MTNTATPTARPTRTTTHSGTARPRTPPTTKAANRATAMAYGVMGGGVLAAGAFVPGAGSAAGSGAELVAMIAPGYAAARRRPVTAGAPISRMLVSSLPMDVSQ